MELTEALARNETLNSQLSEATALGTFAAAERDILRSENERLKEAAQLRLLKESAVSKLGELMSLSPVELTPSSQARILEGAMRDEHAREDDSKLVEALAKHAKQEIDTLIEYGVFSTEGRVTGMGGPSFGASTIDPEKALKEAEQDFLDMDFTPEQAKYAARGRR